MYHYAFQLVLEVLLRPLLKPESLIQLLIWIWRLPTLLVLLLHLPYLIFADTLLGVWLQIQLVWELTEVNAIAKNFIDWLHEIPSFLAVGAAYFEAWRDISSL